MSSHIQTIFFELLENPFPASCSSFFWPGLEEEKAKLDPAYHLKSTNLETRETLAELYRDYKGDELLASTSKEPEAKKTDKLNAVSTKTISLLQIIQKNVFMKIIIIVYKKDKVWWWFLAFISDFFKHFREQITGEVWIKVLWSYTRGR